MSNDGKKRIVAKVVLPRVVVDGAEAVDLQIPLPAFEQKGLAASPSTVNTDNKGLVLIVNEYCQSFGNLLAAKFIILPRLFPRDVRFGILELWYFSMIGSNLSFFALCFLLLAIFISNYLIFPNRGLSKSQPIP